MINRALFYDSIRTKLGPLKKDQVAGFETVLDVIETSPLAHAAYMLATAWWETAKTMQPVREAYWLSEAWRKANLRYYPWYGRGYVQITWEGNYDKADKELSDAGLIKRGALLADRDLAMRPDIAAFIMLCGMREGWFSGDKKGRHTLSRHLPAAGVATRVQYVAARWIINVQDHADDVEDFAQIFERGLRAAGLT